MKTYGGVNVYTQVFLPSAAVGSGCSASREGRFNLNETPSGTQWTGGRVGLKAAAEKRKLLTLRGLKPRPFGRPARGQSLFRLRYHDSWEYTHSKYMCIFVYKTNSVA
jgi:hypothetical protein